MSIQKEYYINLLFSLFKRYVLESKCSRIKFNANKNIFNYKDKKDEKNKAKRILVNMVSILV